MNPRTLTIGLFVSLGLNVFLGGLMIGSMTTKQKGHRHPPAEHRLSSPERDDHNPRPEDDRDDDEDDRKEKRGERDRGGPQGDLGLLREMVHIMGGPDDPRVKKLRETAREDIRTTRKDVRLAHDNLRKALGQEPFDEAALRAAMESVRQRGSAAQARAQEGIVSLAILMTKEEREALRNLPDDGPRERPWRRDDDGPGHDGRERDDHGPDERERDGHERGDKATGH